MPHLACHPTQAVNNLASATSMPKIVADLVKDTMIQDGEDTSLKLMGDCHCHLLDGGWHWSLLCLILPSSPCKALSDILQCVGKSIWSFDNKRQQLNHQEVWQKLELLQGCLFFSIVINLPKQCHFPTGVASANDVDDAFEVITLKMKSKQSMYVDYIPTKIKSCWSDIVLQNIQEVAINITFACNHYCIVTFQIKEVMIIIN